MQASPRTLTQGVAGSPDLSYMQISPPPCDTAMLWPLALQAIANIGSESLVAVNGPSAAIRNVWISQSCSIDGLLKEAMHGAVLSAAFLAGSFSGSGLSRLSRREASYTGQTQQVCQQVGGSPAGLDGFGDSGVCSAGLPCTACTLAPRVSARSGDQVLCRSLPETDCVIRRKAVSLVWVAPG